MFVRKYSLDVLIVFLLALNYRLLPALLLRKCTLKKKS